MSIINSFKKETEISSNVQGKMKFFSYCNKILLPFSKLIIVILVVGFPIMLIFHFNLNIIFKGIMIVFSSAAIGYLTNYIAINMLFLPYRKEDSHWLKIITLGWWKQGLIPENKDDIGIKISKQAKNYINPTDLSNKICTMIKGYIKNDEKTIQLKEWIKSLLEKNKNKIIDFGISEIKKYLKEKTPELLSKKRVTKYIHYIINFVKKDDIKNIISKRIVKTLQNRVPDLMELIRTELSKIIVDFFNSSDYKGDFLSDPLGTIKSWGKQLGRNFIGPKNISKLLIKFINWDSIEKIIYKKISEENTQKIIEEEIISTCDSLLNWLNSKEGDIKFEELLKYIREKAEYLFNKYSDKIINSLFNKITTSEQFYSWIENFLQNSAKPKIEEFIEKEGKNIISKELGNIIENMIVDSVKKTNVEKFHKDIDEVIDKHLGAIQVLGFFLGFVIGILQLIQLLF